MKMFTKVSIALSISTLAFLLSFCTTKPTQTSGGSETGNVALVSGKLYKATGLAISAKVYFVKVNYNPHTGTLAKTHAITDTVITDSSGKYGTNDLDTGTYNIFGVGTDSNLSLVDSFKVTGDTQVVSTDTLKGPSSLAGHIKLQPGAEPDKIIAIAMGSNTFSLIDTVAHFNFANLAEGRYAVKFFSTLDDYSNYDTTFTIVAGSNVSLPESIVIPLKIPIPTGFTLKYDTLKQIVTLSWNRMNPAKVKGYNVYRQHLDSAEVKVNAQPLLDTFYVDSTGVQDQTYIYSVASVDLGNKEGFRTAGDSVKEVGAFIVLDTIGSLGAGSGQFTTILDMCLDLNSALYVTSAEIGTGANAKVQKILDNSTFALAFGASGTSAGQLLEPRGIAVNDSLQIIIAERANKRIQVFDSVGTSKDFLGNNFAGSPWQVLPVGGFYYVAEYHENEYYSTIAQLNIDGTVLNRWGQKGDADGQFRMIWTLQALPNGQVAALDENGVQYFTADGQFVRKIGLRQFGRPQDFAIADSSLYITFSNSDSLRSVIVLGQDGGLRARWFTSLYAFQIAVSSNRIYISDSDGSRILVYRRL